MNHNQAMRPTFVSLATDGERWTESVSDDGGVAVCY